MWQHQIQGASGSEGEGACKTLVTRQFQVEYSRNQGLLGPRWNSIQVMEQNMGEYDGASTSGPSPLTGAWSVRGASRWTVTRDDL